MEIWKSVNGFPMYEVSNLGRIRSYYHWPTYDKTSPTPRVLSPTKRPDNCVTVILCKDRKRTLKYMHRLVARAFIDNPRKLKEVNHKDGNRLNNKLSNLEYVTRLENVIHSLRLGLMKSGEDSYNARLKESDVVEIRRLASMGKNIRCVADKFKISKNYVTKIVSGGCWKKITHGQKVSSIKIICNKCGHVWKPNLPLDRDMPRKCHSCNSRKPSISFYNP